MTKLNLLEMMNKKLLLLLLLILTALARLDAQGLICQDSEPFCTGTIYNFPAGTLGDAQPGPNYGCLNSQPAPAWYHMLIDDPGNINIYMFSTPLEDIDFICWGPFTDPFAPCLNGLTASKIVSCSYSANPTENCYIPNGQTGEYYILLITNFSRHNCNITFSQTSGTGSTDCTILPPLVSNNGPLCVGQTLHLTAANVSNATYAWTGPAGFVSGLQNPVIPNVTLANAGDYTCIITVNGQSSDPTVTTVEIYEFPTASLNSDDTTVCRNTPAFIRLQLDGHGPFEVEYNDGSTLYTATNLWPPVGTFSVYPAASTTYNILQASDIYCSTSLAGMTVNVNTFPQTSAVITGSGSICAGEPAQLTFLLEGTPPWFITYTANGGNPQTVAANSSPHSITVYPSSTVNFELSEVSDLQCSGEVSGSALVTVFPVPLANAGTDQVIPHGTTTVLSGQSSGGSGNYQYAWSPANKLVNPNVAQPATVNLTESTLFTLTVTDNNGECQDLDDVMVTVSGGPLGCNPYASPPTICLNQTAQLFSLPTGGSGEYSYNWSSFPEGYNSTLPDPTVQPEQSTTYYVSVNDGYNVFNGSVTVTVNPLPIPAAGPDQTIPHGTSTQLSGSGSGGSGNYAYQWEPADKLVNPQDPSPTTVNLYTSTLFSLTITDITTGCNSEYNDQVMVTLSGNVLSASAAADPDEICKGQSTTLYAGAGGGSGQYNYTWSSIPAGFYSAEENPVVTPEQTTFYTVAVNDNFNTIYGYVTISVLESPVIDLGSENMTVCVYDTVQLDAGNPGASYLWSNGSTERVISVATTGIGFDVQTPSVIVTNQFGCQANASMTITFNFESCTGIDEGMTDSMLQVYPNPGDGNLKLIFDPLVKKIDISINNLLGQTVYGPVSSQGLDHLESIGINLNFLPDGIYFIRVTVNDKTSQTVKYILNK